jgi:L-xylulose reductase
LINEGANVIGVSRSAGPLNELKEELKGKNFQALQLDLSDWKNTKETLSNLDVQLDGIVNNAGIAIIKPFEEMSEDEYDQVMNVNLKACFNVVQTLLPKLKDGASIVNISSVAGLSAFQGK